MCVIQSSDMEPFEQTHDDQNNETEVCFEKGFKRTAWIPRSQMWRQLLVYTLQIAFFRWSNESCGGGTWFKIAQDCVQVGVNELHPVIFYILEELIKLLCGSWAETNAICMEMHAVTVTTLWLIVQCIFGFYAVFTSYLRPSKKGKTSQCRNLEAFMWLTCWEVHI